MKIVSTSWSSRGMGFEPVPQNLLPRVFLTTYHESSDMIIFTITGQEYLRLTNASFRPYIQFLLRTRTLNILSDMFMLSIRFSRLVFTCSRNLSRYGLHTTDPFLLAYLRNKGPSLPLVRSQTLSLSKKPYNKSQSASVPQDNSYSTMAANTARVYTHSPQKAISLSWFSWDFSHELPIRETAVTSENLHRTHRYKNLFGGIRTPSFGLRPLLAVGFRACKLGFQT